MNLSTLIFYLCAAVGLGMFCFAALHIGKMFLFLRQSKRAQGTVIEIKLHRYGARKSTHLPVVRFTAPNNSTYTFPGRTGSTPPAYKVGDQVVVCYHPRRPSEAVINSFSEIWSMAILYSIFGCAALFAAVVLGLE